MVRYVMSSSIVQTAEASQIRAFVALARRLKLTPVEVAALLGATPPTALRLLAGAVSANTPVQTAIASFMQRCGKATTREQLRLP